MAEIEEIKVDEHRFYCGACDQVIEGELKPIMAKYTEEMNYIDPDYFFLSVAEWDKAPLVSVLKCSDCDNVVPVPVDLKADAPIILIKPGDTVWQCQECGAYHPNPTTASECC